MFGISQRRRTADEVRRIKEARRIKLEDAILAQAAEIRARRGE
jgi:hypothetical protein